MADESGSTERRAAWVYWLVAAVIPAFLLLVGTLWFRAGESDLAIGGAFHSEEGGWSKGDHPLFSILYHQGVRPALLLALAALVTLLVGLFWAPLGRWRRLASYFLLVVVIGPGLLVNATLKEHWGRPRPRDVTEFGGRERFEKVWEYDASSPGKSFPSGHASMGFCLFALYFIGRALRKRWAPYAAAAALVLGTLLGLARIAQGGHFASDVLWSAGICYFVSLGLYHLMRLERQPFSPGGRPSKLFWIPLGLVGVAGALLAVATPYESVKSISGDSALLSQAATCEIDVRLDRAELDIAGGMGFGFEAHVEAFGAMGSSLLDRLEEEAAPDGVYRAKLRQHRSGYFAAIEQPATLTIPRLEGGKVRVEVEKGSVEVALFDGEWDWNIEVADGDLVLHVPDGVEIKISRKAVEGTVENQLPGLEWSAEKARWKRGAEPKLKVRVTVSGDLRIERAAGVAPADEG